MSSYPTVAFLGLGRMGTPMAANLAAGGVPLRVWNRSRERAEAFLDRTTGDVRIAETPADAARDASIVITMLANLAALEDVHAGPHGTATVLDHRQVVVDMSTIGPSGVTRLADVLRPSGAHLVDAPVSGSTSAAASGALAILVGGGDQDVARVRPVLELMGDRVIHLGGTGTGATMKLAVNNVIYGISQAVAEALVLAERAGIDRHLAYEVFVNSAVAAPMVTYRREAFERPGEVPVAFRLELAEKDLRLIEELATSVGAFMPQAHVNRILLQEAMANGFGDDDMSAVAEHLRRTAQVATKPPST